MNYREQKLLAFDDTRKFWKENIALRASVEYGRKHTVLYAEDEYPILPVLGTVDDLWKIADDPNGSLSAQSGAAQNIALIKEGAPFDPVRHRQEIRVTKHRTFEAAMSLHKEYPDKKITVLNFASAVQPGGGVKHGASAQEECLCRCSTLFSTLDRKWLFHEFYDVNRSNADVRHTDACIYSPGVVICKTDEDIPQRLTPQDFVTVDVISCAAPNLRNEPANYHNPETGAPVRMEPNALYELHVKRAKHILHIAAYYKTDILILGAFGCGAFCNDPRTVARAYRDALVNYIGRFDLVEFAVFCRDNETENYDAFRDNFANYI